MSYLGAMRDDGGNHVYYGHEYDYSDYGDHDALLMRTTMMPELRWPPGASTDCDDGGDYDHHVDETMGR